MADRSLTIRAADSPMHLFRLTSFCACLCIWASRQPGTYDAYLGSVVFSVGSSELTDYLLQLLKEF